MGKQKANEKKREDRVKQREREREREREALERTRRAASWNGGGMVWVASVTSHTN